MDITTQLFNWLLDIPRALSEFANWLNQPIADGYFNNTTPLMLLGVGGASIIVAIIVIHVVKLFL